MNDTILLLLYIYTSFIRNTAVGRSHNPAVASFPFALARRPPDVAAVPIANPSECLRKAHALGRTIRPRLS